jgi:formylmethanofuran dehydrogenase subunit E
VAIVENDAYGVDAVQIVAECSFGKGNLAFRDVGNHVDTFFSRATGRGVRAPHPRLAPHSCRAPFRRS